jgi:hypothetical protein
MPLPAGHRRCAGARRGAAAAARLLLLEVAGVRDELYELQKLAFTALHKEAAQRRFVAQRRARDLGKLAARRGALLAVVLHAQQPARGAAGA